MDREPQTIKSLVRNSINPSIKDFYDPKHSIWVTYLKEPRNWALAKPWVAKSPEGIAFDVKRRGIYLYFKTWIYKKIHLPKVFLGKHTRSQSYLLKVSDRYFFHLKNTKIYRKTHSLIIIFMEGQL